MSMSWRERWYEVIFEADTRAGKSFDVLLLVAIFLNVLAVVLESVEGIRARHGGALFSAELFFTVLFTIEWAVVTMTTVGYGDIAPQSPLGKVLASVIMVLGYSVIIVPTGIITAELAYSQPVTTQVCPECMGEGHAPDAAHCKHCGARLATRR